MADNLIGTLLGDSYRLIRVLGEGSVGKVYLAEHVKLGWQSAIKVLRLEYTDHLEIVERFRREARAISRLEHPNIVRLERTGQTPLNQIYMVMEYIPGPSLRQVQREVKPFPLLRALDILKQVCEAVGYAHGKGIIHRDLKPENLLIVSRKGRMNRDVVKILDFGMAKVLGGKETQQLTQEGQVFGTPAYMSPEQCLGRTVDERADIYTVGVLAYELIAGRVPFWSSKHIKLMMQHTEKQPKDPATVCKDRYISPELSKDVLRCLEKKPADRWPTMAALGDRIAYHIEKERRASSDLNSGFLDAYLESSEVSPTDALSTEDRFAGVAPTRSAGTPSESRAETRPKPKAGAEERGTAWYFAWFCRLVQGIAEHIVKIGVTSHEVAALLKAASSAEDELIRQETDFAFVEAEMDEIEARRHRAVAPLSASLYDLHDEKERLSSDPDAQAGRIADIQQEIAALEEQRERLEAGFRPELARREHTLEQRLLSLPDFQEKHSARHFALADAVVRHRPTNGSAALDEWYDALGKYRDYLEKAGYGVY